MIRFKYFHQMLVVLIAFMFSSCEEFLELEAPNNKMVSEVVFENEETAISAMTGIYNQLFNASFSGGAGDSVTILAGLSGDNLTTIRATNLTYTEFDQHELLPNNPRLLNLWSSAYNIIYNTNSLLEGIENSETISIDLRTRLEGEAKFVRAFTYFYLVNLFGDVPLILTTDYRQNALKYRDSQQLVYQQIVEDLDVASGFVNSNYNHGERTQVNSYAVLSLLARVHLYLQNWDLAVNYSSQVIEANGTYELLDNLDEVFLKNSKEAIWQLSPEARGNNFTYTNEGFNFLINPTILVLSHLKLKDDFISTFNEVDKRLISWIGFNARIQGYYANKYKIRLSTDEVTEYSMVLRLAEQYLIRAEARSMLGDLPGAIEDINKIRERAGVDLIEMDNPLNDQTRILEMLLEEKNKELFTEWGHGWLDLKRTGRATMILGGSNPFWEETDLLYPVPENERIKNPNLTQNDGY